MSFFRNVFSRAEAPVETTIQDLRYGLRLLRRSPGVAAGLDPTNRQNRGSHSLNLVGRLVAMAACVLPTRRALRVDPLEAIRGD